jgi:hypothetical protein
MKNKDINPHNPYNINAYSPFVCGGHLQQQEELTKPQETQVSR